MDDDLLATVLDRLDASSAPPEVERLLLAALDGDVALAGALDQREDFTAVGSSQQSVAVRPGEEDAPAAAFVSRLTVTGFRGIGPTATLEFSPGPGLTVVCGRNGSGKSSFAEAFEVLLTGSVRRFEARSEVWRDGWRCLHAPAAEVTAELLVEGHPGPVRLRRVWDGGAALDAGRVDGLDGLGWEAGLRNFRPFLTHSELESMLGAPKALHDQLNDILGLDDLTGAGRRLAAARLAADKAVKAPKDGLAGLRDRLTDVEDDRAMAALAALGRVPDFDVLEALAAGLVSGDARPTGALEALQHLSGPDPAALGAAASALRQAADGLDRLAGSRAADAAATASLLEAALDRYGRHGPGDCPVCAAPGRLDRDWRAATESTVTRLLAEAADLRAATDAADEAFRHARGLVAFPPAALGVPDVGIDTSSAAGAWSAWSETPTVNADAGGLRAWAAHLVDRGANLVGALGSMRRAAAEEAGRRADRWAPLAAELTVWCRLARQAQAATPNLADLRRTETWLKAANDQIRNDRLRPFAERTVALWAQLRQESNVDLAAVRLAGSATHARVDFDVTVDGNGAAALGVMSQGEVNALALSVFLPRATMVASPFRFLVIDDPVQAMDPSKVDGLARVLAAVAADRQVIVFTHDDRLPDSVRRLGLDARIVAVTRRPGSVVTVHVSDDPCTQLLRDARQLTQGDEVPVAVARRVLPGLCRAAIETVCIDVVRRRRLAAGAGHADVETAIIDADRLTTKAALAIFDDPRRGGDVYRWLNTNIGNWATTTFQTANRGAHGDDATFDPARLVEATGELTARLRNQLR